MGARRLRVAFEGWKFPTTQEVKRIGKGMAELDVWN